MSEMNEAVVMQGVRTSRRTIRLDEDLPILSRRLRVTVEELPETRPTRLVRIRE